MKMVATVKYRRTASLLFNSRPFALKIREMVSDLQSSLDRERFSHVLFEKRPVEKRLFIVIGTDRGFCGSFNSNLCKKVLEETKNHPGETNLLLIGKKTRSFFRKSGLPVYDAILNLNEKMYADFAGEVSVRLIEDFRDGKFDEITVFYNEFKSVLQTRIRQEKLIPVSLEMPAQNKAEYIYEPVLPEILSVLLPRYIVSQFYIFLLESKAAEEAGRMNTMDLAAKNADDLLEELKMAFNKARQWTITRELADISVVVEAMS